MKHLTEEQIVLHCFGDADHSAEIDQHLNECLECRETFNQVKAMLASIETTSVPEPHESLEQKIWLKLQDRLPKRRPGILQRVFSPVFAPGSIAPGKWATAGAMAVLLLAAFIIGRFWPRGP